MLEFLAPEELAEIHGPVKVYRNLRYSNRFVFSVKQSRLVGYVEQIVLEDVEFVIRRSEQQRAVFRHERNVHAWAQGRIAAITFAALASWVDEHWRRARYNCFKFDEFVDMETEQPIRGARYVHLSSAGFFYLPEGVSSAS